METQIKIAVRRLKKLGFVKWESNGDMRVSTSRNLRVVVEDKIFIDFDDLWDKRSRCPIQVALNTPYGVLRSMVNQLNNPEGREHSLNWDGIVFENDKVEWRSELYSGWRKAIEAMVSV